MCKSGCGRYQRRIKAELLRLQAGDRGPFLFLKVTGKVNSVELFWSDRSQLKFHDRKIPLSPAFAL
jgi:hypothetical protein